MRRIRITLFVKSERVSTSCADTDSLGHECASPMRTGAYDRMGSETIVLNQEQEILRNAAIRACEKMKWELVIEDASKYGFLKRLRAKEAIPRLEGNGKLMTGIPTSDEIIEFFKVDDLDELLDIPEIRTEPKLVENL
ncbi:MAG: hypothetical protein ACFE7R_00025 [Candidatus Hodarchaeota archaeon]